jgi:erythronate-4-phosphate dehydrogenase
MIHIVADDKIPFLKGVLEPFAKVVYLPGEKITHSDILRAHCLITRTRTICDKHLLHGTNVRFIATATSGHEHIDTDYCEKHNISWYHASGCNASSVVQYIASALATLSIQDGITLCGKTIGIIGAGHVGSKVAELALTLGMIVLINDPPRARNEKHNIFVPLDKIMADSDIVTIHVPLNFSGPDKTYHLCDESFFSHLRKGTYFINTSRGEVADSKALKTAINADRIKACILDVWDNEPYIETDLLGMVRIATPHIAGYSAEGKANGTKMCVDAINMYFHLGMEERIIPVLPEPPRTMVTIDCSGKTPESILREAIRMTYAIEEDHERLLNSPDTFEKQRGEYPVRREFPAYSVHIVHPVKNIEQLLEHLGFRIL